MRAELANLNNCAVPFLSRATASLFLYNACRCSYDIYTLPGTGDANFGITTDRNYQLLLVSELPTFGITNPIKV